MGVLYIPALRRHRAQNFLNHALAQFCNSNRTCSLSLFLSFSLSLFLSHDRPKYQYPSSFMSSEGGGGGQLKGSGGGKPPTYSTSTYRWWKGEKVRHRYPYSEAIFALGALYIQGPKISKIKIHQSTTSSQSLIPDLLVLPHLP